MTTLRRKIDFDMLVSLMKKGHGVVLCGKQDEPSIEITLKKDEYPSDLAEALNLVEQYWDDL